MIFLITMSIYCLLFWFMNTYKDKFECRYKDLSLNMYIHTALKIFLENSCYTTKLIEVMIKSDICLKFTNSVAYYVTAQSILRRFISFKIRQSSSIPAVCWTLKILCWAKAIKGSQHNWVIGANDCSTLFQLTFPWTLQYQVFIHSIWNQSFIL